MVMETDVHPGLYYVRIICDLSASSTLTWTRLPGYAKHEHLVSPTGFPSCCPCESRLHSWVLRTLYSGSVQLCSLISCPSPPPPTAFNSPATGNRLQGLKCIFSVLDVNHIPPVLFLHMEQISVTGFLVSYCH